jgi:hypothetical protein
MFESKLCFTIKWPVIQWLLTWVTIARASQGLVDNASMVVGLDNWVGYELIPHLNGGRCGSDSHWTLSIPPRSDVVVGVLKAPGWWTDVSWNVCVGSCFAGHYMHCMLEPRTNSYAYSWLKSASSFDPQVHGSAVALPLEYSPKVYQSMDPQWTT